MGFGCAGVATRPRWIHKFFKPTDRLSPKSSAGITSSVPSGFPQTSFPSLVRYTCKIRSGDARMIKTDKRASVVHLLATSLVIMNGVEDSSTILEA